MDYKTLKAFPEGFDPVGLRVTLRQMWERYHLPLLICGRVTTR